MTSLILATMLSLPSACGPIPGAGHGFHPFKAVGRALFGPRAAYRAQACGGASLYVPPAASMPPRASVPVPQAPGRLAGPCPGGACFRP